MRCHLAVTILYFIVTTLSKYQKIKRNKYSIESGKQKIQVFADATVLISSSARSDIYLLCMGSIVNIIFHKIIATHLSGQWVSKSNTFRWYTYQVEFEVKDRPYTRLLDNISHENHKESLRLWSNTDKWSQPQADLHNTGSDLRILHSVVRTIYYKVVTHFTHNAEKEKLITYWERSIKRISKKKNLKLNNAAHFFPVFVSLRNFFFSQLLQVTN